MSHRLSSDSPPSLMKAGTPVLISERGHSSAAPPAFDQTGTLFLVRRAVSGKGRKVGQVEDREGEARGF